MTSSDEHKDVTPRTKSVAAEETTGHNNTEQSATKYSGRWQSVKGEVIVETTMLFVNVVACLEM